MSVIRISGTERSSFPQSSGDAPSERLRHRPRVARLEKDGNQDASSNGGETHEQEHEAGVGDRAAGFELRDGNEPTVRHEESLESLLERLKTAHRLDLRL
jgi:hypothetical protein